ncbi:amino acid ABC transporter permease [Microbacterium azadirachtae]|uniref:Polar amino acid transport system permease protein n=1 Tax=Microbacterium azadirachtae TaxID=582680 RepID=A0A1I6G5X2_9MICO|nr:amino acid ABC transporter permease [Microbacterium azadirachtae]SDL35133.1 polar amino acid transport system permease protein [Microbacterium azadirachtae]SEF65785.1 polar amino acid transport system permease protein [Microbacterium azadirachtae]SEF66583.1 polar amino acid transport system permease protein [Microbacterium azadirachtae]SFR37579.1 polar amino acid transport system permease protein [Microbacterium azadirachtae]
MSTLTTPRNVRTSVAGPTPAEIAALPIRPRVGPGIWITTGMAVYAGLLLVQLFVFNDNWRWDVVASYLFSQVVLTGLFNTIVLTLLTTACGLVLGVVTAYCRMSSLPVLRTFATLYIGLMRATPPLVMLLFVFFFGALVPTLAFGIPFGPTFFAVPTSEVVSRFSAAVIGLSIYFGAFSAEIFRSGVLALPPGQLEACKALGLPPLRAYQKILAPQIIRVITPAMANEVITVFKNTSLVSVIGYSELLTTVQTIYARNFETIPLLMVAVVWYLVLTSIATFAQAWLERRVGHGFGHRSTSKRRWTRAIKTPSSANTQEDTR